MSITLISTPINPSPAYGEHIWTLDAGALVNESGFRYICEIFDGTDKIAELKAEPHPIHGWGKINSQSVIQSFMEFNTSFTEPVFSAQDSWKTLAFSFGWEYEGTRVTGDTTANRTVFNASPTYLELTNWQTAQPYNLTGTASNKFPLTERRSIRTREDTKQWLYYFTNSHTNVRLLEVRNNADNSLQYIDLPVGLRNQDSGRMTGWRVDKPTVDALFGNNLQSWSVRTITEGSVATSEWINFSVKGCNRWNPFSLYWLNRWGGMDSLPFDGRSVTRIEGSREHYNRVQPRINASGTVDWDSALHSRRTYHATSVYRYRLTTDWLLESEQWVLDGLISSPLVWMETENVLYPVQLRTNSVEIKQGREGVIFAAIEVDRQDNSIRQRA